MTRFTTSLIVGILAGAASAVTALGPVGSSVISMLVFALPALPILIAGLGWGSHAAIAAALSFAVITAVAASPLVAFNFLVTTIGPAAWIGHLANLARPAEEIGGPQGSLAWFPLSDILMRLCLAVAAGAVILDYSIGLNAEMSGRIVDQFMAALAAQDSALDMSETSIASLKTIFHTLLPAFQALSTVLITFAMFYLATVIVRVSGQARRPKDDIPTGLRLPALAALAPAIGLAMTFGSGIIAIAGSALVGAFAAGYIMSGFAILHERTRGRPWRPIALWFSYLAVLLFTLPIILFLIAGFIESRRTIPVSKADT